MQWDAGPNAGFTAGDPWLPVNPNYTWLNAAAQIDHPDTVFAHYQALIRLRHELPVLVDGDFTPLMADDPQIWAYTRTSPGRATPRHRQLRTRAPDRRHRPGMDRGRPAARQPARYPGHVDVIVARPGRLGRAHLPGDGLTGSPRREVECERIAELECPDSKRSGLTTKRRACRLPGGAQPGPRRAPSRWGG